MRVRNNSVFTGIILLALAGFAFAQSPNSDAFGIRLKSRTFVPSPDTTGAVDAVVKAYAGKRVHVLIQFQNIPNTTIRKELEQAGIKLLNYVPNNAWFASAPTNLPANHSALASVRWIGKILPEDKIAQQITQKGIPLGARTDDGQAKLVVKLFGDVDIEAAQLILKGHGASILGIIPRSTNIVIAIAEEKITDLAGEDVVRWIEPSPPPPVAESDRIRAHVQVETAQETGLTGNGVAVGVFENHHISMQHPDFGGRITQGDAAPYTPDTHATRVAGLIAGDGGACYLGHPCDNVEECKDHCDYANQWRGMAPATSVFSYDKTAGGVDWQVNFVGDLQEAVNNDLIDIANNSWGELGCNTIGYGDYLGLSPILDAAARGEQGVDRPVIMVFSAGNERDGYGEPATKDCITDIGAPYRNYGTINYPKAAKNIITVGAVDSFGAMMMSTYSSWGPVDDGRLKPDIVASGHHNGRNDHGVSVLDSVFGNPIGADNQQGYRTPNHPTVDYNYGWSGATSGAAATTSGSIALLLEAYQAQYPERENPLPSTVKALLVHSALDLDGTNNWYNPGPDYSSGYGLLQTHDAVNLVNNRSFLEGAVQHDDSAYFFLRVPADAQSAKITLAWDDPPAAENAMPALVNDLDLIVLDPQRERYYPWVLDPQNESSDAVHGEDHVNNLEQVYVDNITTPGTWEIIVKGTLVSDIKQRFSIVASGLSARPALEKVVLTGDTAPNGAIIETISGRVAGGATKGFDVNDAGNVIYHATLRNGQEGIFTSAGETIAITDQPSPDNNGNFTSFYTPGRYDYLSINNHDEVVYLGLVDAAGEELEGTFSKTETLALQERPSPDGRTYRRFVGNDINDAGLTLFTAKTVSEDSRSAWNIYSQDSVLLINGDSQVPGNGSLMQVAGSPIVRLDSSAVYMGSFVYQPDGDPPPPPISGQGVFSSDGINFGRAGDVAPGGGEFATGTAKFNFPDANNNAEAAFLAELNTGESGVFTSTTRIAIEGGAAPGDGEFVSLSGSPSINDNNLVVYVGVRSDGRTGIFDSNNNIIALTGQQAYDEFKLTGLAAPVLTNRGQVAFYGRVSDGAETKEGIFITALPVNTLIGRNVDVNAGNNVRLTFAQVTDAGSTTAIRTSCLAEALAGFTILPVDIPVCYDTETTAVHIGTVDVCLGYDDAEVADETALKLMHYEIPPEGWVDITTNIDENNNIICGQASHLSQFSVMLAQVEPDTGFSIIWLILIILLVIIILFIIMRRFP